MVETPIIAKIEGKTTPFGFTVRLEQSVNRTAFLFCEHEKTEYILGVQRVWKDSKGSYASVRVVGQVPQTPFNISTEIRLASDLQIQTALGLSLAPEKSLFVGKLLHTPLEVRLNIEKLGRIFITGKSGSGKSYTVGVFIEELLKKKVPVLVIDRHGEYSSLKVLQRDQIPDTEEFFKKGDPERNFAQGIIEFGDPTLNPGVDLTLDDLMLCESKDLIEMGQCTLINLRGLELSRQEEVADWVLKKVYKSKYSPRNTQLLYFYR